MIHVIYIAIIVALLTVGAFFLRRMSKDLDKMYENSQFWYNRSEAYRLDNEKHQSGEAYAALDQGMQEVTDAYASDELQWAETRNALDFQIAELQEKLRVAEEERDEAKETAFELNKKIVNNTGL